MRNCLLLTTMGLLTLTACRKTNSSTPDPIPHNKALVWEKTLGGSQYDHLYQGIQTTAGDYVVVGATRSTDGDVPMNTPRGGYDYWIGKVDANGNAVWNKTFGANNDEYALAVAAASDGGFVFAGFEYATSGGQFSNLAKVIKVDANGNKQWEKQISGSNDAKPMSIVASGDGGFLVAGYEKVSRGDRDGWVAKIGADGTVLWSKNFGGSGEDQFYGIQTVAAGGCIVSGTSRSASGDLNGNKGDFDAWLVRIDAAGNKSWSQSFGTAGNDEFKAVTTAGDGGFVAAGSTTGNGGDIPSSHGGNEAWILKVDASGAKQWSKTYGGLNEEYISGVAKAGDGFIMAGQSNSTTFDVARQAGDFGGWVVKTDGTGNKTATSTYGNRFDELVGTILATADGGHLIVGYQDSGDKGYNGLLVKIGPL